MAELLTLEERTQEGPGTLAWEWWPLAGPDSAPARTTARAREGRSSLAWSAPSASFFYGVLMSRPVPLRAPTDPHTLRCSVTALLAPAALERVYVYLNWYDAAVAQLGEPDIRILNPRSTGWVDVAMAATPPPGAVWVRPSALVANQSAGQQVFLDAVSLTDLQPAALANAPATYELGGIVFNTRTPDGDGLTWYGNLAGLGGSTPRVEDVPRGGLDGSFFPGGRHGTRQLTLAGKVLAPDFAGLKRARDRLAAALNLVHQVGPLVVNDPAPFRLEVYRADALQYEPDSLVVASFQVGLVAPDPRRFGVGEYAQTTNLSTVNTGVTAPVTAPVNAGGGSASQILATNAGTTDTPVVLEVRGPVTNPVVQHDESGHRIALALELTAVDTLVLDSDARTITIGGSSRRYAVAGLPQWFDLAPGPNSIRLSAASTDPAATLTVRWRDAYI